MDSLHLDSSSFHVDGNYINNTACEEAQPEGIEITYGYSRDHRPDLKQFILDLMQWGWGYSLVLESRRRWIRLSNVCDPPRGLQTAMANRCLICGGCRTLHARESATNVSFALGVESTRHPDCCKTLLENMPEEAFNDSVISGYRIAPCWWVWWCTTALVGRWKSSQKRCWPQTVGKRLTKHLSKAQLNFGCCLNKNLLAQKMLWLLLNGSVMFYTNWLISRLRR